MKTKDIQNDQLIAGRRLNIVFINKEEKEVKMIDVAFPTVMIIKDKEFKK